MKTAKFKYNVEIRDPLSEDLMEKELDELGEQGWKLVSVIVPPNGARFGKVWYYFIKEE